MLTRIEQEQEQQIYETVKLEEELVNALIEPSQPFFQSPL